MRRERFFRRFRLHDVIPSHSSCFQNPKVFSLTGELAFPIEYYKIIKLRSSFSGFLSENTDDEDEGKTLTFRLVVSRMDDFGCEKEMKEKKKRDRSLCFTKLCI